MAQYIDKGTLVAEIERRIKSANNDVNIGAIESLIISKTLNGFKSFIDTLEVKEMDLEKEIKDYFDSQPIITRSKGVDYQLIPSSEDIAKHFFELGLKAKNK